MDTLNDSSNETVSKSKESSNSHEESAKNQCFIEKSDCEYQMESLEQAFQTILNVSSFFFCFK